MPSGRVGSRRSRGSSPGRRHRLREAQTDPGWRAATEERRRRRPQGSLQGLRLTARFQAEGPPTVPVDGDLGQLERAPRQERLADGTLLDAVTDDVERPAVSDLLEGEPGGRVERRERAGRKGEGPLLPHLQPAENPTRHQQLTGASAQRLQVELSPALDLHAELRRRGLDQVPVLALLDRIVERPQPRPHGRRNLSVLDPPRLEGA
jgi:hypothetical protein